MVSSVKFSVMIAEAIKSLADRKGSSKIAIQKYIAANYEVGVNYERTLKKALKAGLEDKTLSKPKGIGLTGSFKLTTVEKSASKKVIKKPAAKEKVDKTAAAKKASPVKKGKITKKVVKKAMKAKK
jgi:histone H1/5